MTILGVTRSPFHRHPAAVDPAIPRSRALNQLSRGGRQFDQFDRVSKTDQNQKR